MRIAHIQHITALITAWRHRLLLALPPAHHLRPCQRSLQRTLTSRSRLIPSWAQARKQSRSKSCLPLPCPRTGTISHRSPQRRANAKAGEQRVEIDTGERKVEGGAQSDGCATRGRRTATPGNCEPTADATADWDCCRRYPPSSISGQLLISVYYRHFVSHT